MIKRCIQFAMLSLIVIAFQNCARDNNFAEEDQTSKQSSSNTSSSSNICPDLNVPVCAADEELSIVYNNNDCAFALCRDKSNNGDQCGPMGPLTCSPPLVATPSYDSDGCLRQTCEPGNPSGDDTGGGDPGGGDPGPTSMCSFGSDSDTVRVVPGQSYTRAFFYQNLSVTNYREGNFGRSGAYCFQQSFACSESGEPSYSTQYIHISDDSNYSSNFRNSYTDEQCDALATQHSSFYQSWAGNNYDAVQQAYQDHLGRAADVNGLEFYFYAMKFSGLSLNQVVTNLSISVEARIRNCYLDHLRREPDSAGMEFYKGEVAAERIDVPGVCHNIFSSPERSIVDCYERYSNKPQNQWRGEYYGLRVINNQTTVDAVCQLIENGLD
ncbi:MAG: hypothetical protein HRT45_08410 [Bdellovibrionales bacterium]|nr:hypothetical protein [Bdellovibrionales bacterium]